MARLHFSFLNTDYNQDVLNTWGDNIEIVKQKLGYRFALTQSTVTTKARPRGQVNVGVKIRNDGWAAPYNPRQVQLVFQNDKHTFKVNVPADPRRWGSRYDDRPELEGRRTACPRQVPVADHLPDPLLSTRPEYSIRLANDGTWQPSTGYNDLGQTVTIG